MGWFLPTGPALMHRALTIIFLSVPEPTMKRLLVLCDCLWAWSLLLNALTERR